MLAVSILKADIERYRGKCIAEIGAALLWTKPMMSAVWLPATLEAMILPVGLMILCG